MKIQDNLTELKSSLPEEVSLVAVSKTKPESDLMEVYEVGQRIFGENKIQEMVSKWEQLPKDIQWHMIGHVQTNKVKYIAPFVDTIHAVDRIKVLNEIQKQAEKNNRTISCLIQICIATEDTKFGLAESDLDAMLEAASKCKNVRIKGLMGMASFTSDTEQIRAEFKKLAHLYNQHPEFEILSMGMSGDYPIAIEEGSNMIRVGSKIFGERNY
ncbi:YggS family pyridoxal phosphate-dependent enzyme [Flavobacteriaceae bacterium]|jgi:pyridoxal phosphate enzyme (YggS family)|nr:YggS family pyridoxal phosphate-dependent enzyme [Flavobacteriaceae bacterium]MDA9037701.1 YggS family pyridoxal phosphate-dependent enzyme [Flavobacteriaceae bacterium]